MILDVKLETSAYVLIGHRHRCRCTFISKIFMRGIDIQVGKIIVVLMLMYDAHGA